jgi:hypothetical protein
MSGMDSCPDRIETDAGNRVRKKFTRLPQIEICACDFFDDIGYVLARDRRTHQRAKRRFLVRTSADRDLIIFLAVLLDAKQAHMSHVMMTTGIDAT